jgi:hypothetical protein
MLVHDRVGGTRPRVQIAKAAITGDDVGDTFFYRAVVAVPIHITCTDVDYCAPGRVTTSMTRASSPARRRRKCSDANDQFRASFNHDLIYVCFSDTFRHASAFSMYRFDASYAVEVQRAHPGRSQTSGRWAPC